MCIVVINVLEPGAFNTEFQYFIPLFNKISLLCREQPGGYEGSNEGCNSGPTGHDFTDISIKYTASVAPVASPILRVIASSPRGGGLKIEGGGLAGLPLKYERLFYLNGLHANGIRSFQLMKASFFSVWGGAFLSIKEKRKKKPWNALPDQKRG
jgi:hypothetical protein